MAIARATRTVQATPAYTEAMTGRRSATSVTLWAFVFVVSLIVVSWFVLLRFSDEPTGGPGSAAPSLGSYEQTYDLKP